MNYEPFGLSLSKGNDQTQPERELRLYRVGAIYKGCLNAQNSAIYTQNKPQDQLIRARTASVLIAIILCQSLHQRSVSAWRLFVLGWFLVQNDGRLANGQLFHLYLCKGCRVR